MSYENTERIAAIAPEKVGVIFPQLLALFGEEIADGRKKELTIGAFWDDEGKTRKRAASLIDGTITPVVLTDGRVAYRCLWQSDLVAAWQSGQLPDVEELSEKQLADLLPKTEEFK